MACKRTRLLETSDSKVQREQQVCKSGGEREREREAVSRVCG